MFFYSGLACVADYLDMSIATDYIYISWDVRGLSDGIKCVTLFSALKPYRSAIVCLQEMHLHTDTIPLLKSRAYQT